MTEDAEVAQSANVPMAVEPSLTGPMQVNGRGDLLFKAAAGTGTGLRLSRRSTDR
jgi:hypothetical protein